MEIRLSLTDFRALVYGGKISHELQNQLRRAYANVCDDMEEDSVEYGESIEYRVDVGIENDWED